MVKFVELGIVTIADNNVNIKQKKEMNRSWRRIGEGLSTSFERDYMCR